MTNWFKRKFKEVSFILPSILIFLVVLITIGFDSDGVREFLLNILGVSTTSLFATVILAVFAVHNQEDEANFPILLFWAVIALGLAWS